MGERFSDSEIDISETNFDEVNFDVVSKKLGELKSELEKSKRTIKQAERLLSPKIETTPKTQEDSPEETSDSINRLENAALQDPDNSDEELEEIGSDDEEETGSDTVRSGDED